MELFSAHGRIGLKAIEYSKKQNGIFKEPESSRSGQVWDGVRSVSSPSVSHSFSCLN